MIRRLFARLFGCQHRDTFVERRPLHGVQILHFVCHTCGHAAPAMDRSAREHRRMVKAGAVKRSHAQAVTSKVTPMRGRR